MNDESIPGGWARGVGTTLLLGLAALIALALALAGCGASDRSSRSQYTPVPDEALYSDVASIPGVKRVAISYTDSFGNSNNYSGNVYVAADVGARQVLDKVIAILRQGRPGASMQSIGVLRGDSPAVFPDALGVHGVKDYETRYGKQPGSGKPPSSPLPSPSP